MFRKHGDVIHDMPIRTYETLKKLLEEHEIEGLIIHHSDRRMDKIKRRDFGLQGHPKRS